MRSKLIQAGVCTGMVLSVLGQSSADYRLEHATTDLGAGRQSSATYSVHSSLGGLGGTASAGDETVRTGFAGQLNEPPQAGADGLARIAGKAAKIFIPDLLGNDTDLEANSITFAGASPMSANGAEIIVDGNWLIYASTDGTSGNDVVRYFLVDDFGGMASGEIVVSSAGSETGTLLTLLRIEVFNNGALKRIGFVGIAGRTYRIEASAQLENATWETIGTAMAEENGVYWFEDAEALPARFYRSVAF